MNNLYFTLLFLLPKILVAQQWSGPNDYTSLISRTGPVNITGDVGLGTSTPLGKLNIYGATYFSGSQGSFVLTNAYQTGDHFMAIAPNSGGTYMTNWDWTKSLNFNGNTGELQKSVSSNTDIAFSVVGASSVKNLKIYGDGDVVIGNVSQSGSYNLFAEVGIYAPKVQCSNMYSLNNGDISISTITNSTENQVMRIYNGGKVLIGNVTTPGDYKLYVETGILTEKLKIATHSTTPWMDKVFNKKYQLRSIESLQEFIENYGHLPNMPSEKEIVKSGGIDVFEMMKLQQQKIEELTLYIIELNEKIKQQKQ